MNRHEQSNEDIAREAARYQNRSKDRKKDRAYKRATRQIVGGALAAGAIATYSAVAGGGGEKASATGEPINPDRGNNPTKPSTETPTPQETIESNQEANALHDAVENGEVAETAASVDQPLEAGETVTFENQTGGTPAPDQEAPETDQDGGTEAPSAN